MSSNWLDVIPDQKILNSYWPSCITLCDVKNDENFQMILADVSKDLKTHPKLKMFKGTKIINDQILPGIPLALVSFYTNEGDPKTIIAVAISSSVLFYRNLKPYFKFTLPGLNVESLERDIWNKLAVECPEKQELLINELQNSIDFMRLTIQSQRLISLPKNKRQDFIKEHTDSNLERYSTITALLALERNSSTLKPPACLIIATENGEIIFLDTHSFIILHQAKICSLDIIPNFLSASGYYDTDFRLIISSREGYVCLLKKSWFEGQVILKLEHPIISISLIPIEQTIVAVCMDKKLRCFSKKGKILWTIEFENCVSCMELINLSHLSKTLTCVAQKNGIVRFYSGKNLVDEFDIKENISGMVFGRLGYEENVLIFLTSSGKIIIKILKRTAEFSIKPSTEKLKCYSLIEELEIQNNLLIKDQVHREIGNSKGIYNNFQYKLWQLRLTAARDKLDGISEAKRFLSESKNASIRLSADFFGSGPDFNLILTIENITLKKSLSNLCVLLHADPKLYNLSHVVTKLPVLTSNMPIKIDFKVSTNLVNETGLPILEMSNETTAIRVMITKDQEKKPLLAAIVSIPGTNLFTENE